MTIRQNIMSPEEPIEGLAETKAQLKVPNMMRANSTPYMRLRPKALSSPG
jgi:hypothetical protein